MTHPPKRYRRAPSYVTAIQYDGTVESAIACGLKENPITYRRYVDGPHDREWVDKGDWIVTDELDHKHVVDPNTFSQRYVEDEEAPAPQAVRWLNGKAVTITLPPRQSYLTLDDMDKIESEILRRMSKNLEQRELMDAARFVRDILPEVCDVVGVQREQEEQS